MPRSPTLRIRLLGGFRAELDGKPIPDADWRRNRARAVVKLLALAPGYRLHREQLMDMLWPELEASNAGANLRKAIHFARGALGSSTVVVRDDHVALAAQVEVDATSLLAALDAGRLEEAIELYGGELLPEDRFEPWTDEPRERLRAAYLRALGDLAARRESEGDLEGSMSLLARMVSIETLDEEAHQRLMRLHAATGQRHLALRQFRQLERALRDELDLEPSAESWAQFRAIAADQVAPVRGRAGASEELAERRLVTAVAVRSADRASGSSVLRVLETWGASPGHGVSDVDGDADMIALFGEPVIGEDDAERAVSSALEVARVAPGTRIGIATGETVVTFAVGIREGPSDAGPSSLARILADRAEPGVPLASDRTARAVGRRFRFGAAVSIPGLPSARTASAVLGLARGDAPDLVETPFVGRGSEVESVVGFMRDVVEQGTPRLVLLTGPAGVGKSRLVREVIARFADTKGSARPTARVLRGRSLSGGRGATYWALGELLREACSITLADSPEDMERRLRRTVDTTLGSLPAEDREMTTAALATSAGIHLGANPLDGEKPDEVSKVLAVAWPRFTSGLAAAMPTVLVLEDLHWASPELVEMVELLVARSAGPLLVLATARPDFGDANPGFGTSIDATTIALGPLSEGESLDLVGHLTGEASTHVADRARILDRAEGNPLYLEQLTTHLHETGTEGLPDTLQSLLGARLDALAPRDRRVLQEASVLGRAFWSEPLERALPGERVAARLGLLERKRFVVRRPDSTLPGHDEWAFRHALLHDVAYRSVPPVRRSEAHARAGTWLEGIAGSRVDEVADLLAHHFEAALGARLGRPDKERRPADEETGQKAVDYLIRAGEGARRRFALDRAVDLHQRAARIAIEDGAARVRSLEALADDHDAGFHGDAAALAYHEALALVRASGTGGPDVLARIARKLAWLMVWNPGAFRASPDPAEAEALVAEGLAAGPGPLERGWLLLARGTAARLYRGSEPFGQGTRWDPRPLRDRIADVDEALAISRTLPDAGLAAAAGHARGMLYGFEGRFREMLDLARAEVAGLPRDASNIVRSDALRRLAVHLINIEGDFETGIELGRQCHALAGDTGPHQLLHTMWPVMSGSFQLGRWTDVAELVDEATSAFRLEPATECQFVRDVPVIAGAALAMLGHRDDGLDLAALSGDPMADRESASAWQSRFATLTGRPAVSVAISVDKALEHRIYGPQHAYALVEALEALEDWAGLAAFRPQARSAIAGNAALRPLLDRAEGRARAAAGDSADARRMLRRSVAGFRRLGMAYEEGRTRAALAELDPSARASGDPHGHRRRRPSG